MTSDSSVLRTEAPVAVSTGHVSPDYDDCSSKLVDLPHDFSIEGPFAEGNPAGPSVYDVTFRGVFDVAGKLDRPHDLRPNRLDTVRVFGPVVQRDERLQLRAARHGHP